MSFVLRVVINAAAIWLATRLLGGLHVVGGDDAVTTVLVHLLVGFVLALVHAVVKPVVAFFTFPLYVLTLGLFTLVVNALMLLLTGWLSERMDVGLRVDDFGTAVVGALIVSVVGFVLTLVVPGARERERKR